MIALTALFAAGFAAIHLFIGKLRFLDVIPRSRWLSFAGGVAVAYVFLHILPDLAASQETLGREAAAAGLLASLERHVYLLALAGLAAFYGLERAVKGSRAHRPEGGGGGDGGGGDEPGPGVFWLHIGSFGLYNVLIGYLLLHREETGLAPLLLYFVAMGLHFVTNDFGLRQDHKRLYDRTGRWVIAAGVALGWAIGAATTVSEAAVDALFALLAGGVVLNVLKEELPEERRSRFWPFAAGVAGYGALLLVAAG